MRIIIKNFKEHSLYGIIQSKLLELGYTDVGAAPIGETDSDIIFPDLKIKTEYNNFFKTKVSCSNGSNLEDIDKFLKLKKEELNLISEICYKVILKHSLGERTFSKLEDAFAYARSIVGEHHIITVCRTEIGE